ncbi:division/cell wall cluster transcriptional repressor MraZ [Streptomyces cocklensis]|jgi:MraZ protein|uniref:Transcriptional regulator MraZ n=1 Tax=Actinacidiphila cocklensis TaxID=887465 RepID=A0A9W4DUH2_9ACTN|nr:division/cell wall cluster transcriptional repressor MraZ [Actinacidiphila cocklensis]MDD1060409.1 division/cell wall cluster transcriptional repressor MraZ [Actinacidiphila cocklensis]WSX74049.1 division/cell wall cluster transcriptional repressor MraZ [Streptomyces sp. NBC_00899]WSX79886.1 division/cell wall cluster transcriptional repressor MraZ [Streptomyces sp. NBC_00899]CAG6395757.1 inhibitor of RsmH and transcriptional regulator [Actinacidiphila cocklensis]
MFLGTYTPRLDDKHRLVLPARFREPLADGLVITRGQERCLCVWPVEGFKAATQQLSAAPLTSKSARDYLRVLFAGAHDEVPDKQGRVTVPQSLREYAGLERDCAVIGANTRVEIWSSTAWADYLAAQEDTFSALSQEVPPGLL